MINFSSNIAFLGNFACVQLQLYEEAIIWCHIGLAVSFYESFNISYYPRKTKQGYDLSGF